jgi:hypothetical protein
MKKVKNLFLVFVLLLATQYGISTTNENVPISRDITYSVENVDAGGYGCEYTVTIKVKISDGLRAHWSSQTKTISFGDTETYSFIYDNDEYIIEETATITYSGGSNMYVSDMRISQDFDDCCLDSYDDRYNTVWVSYFGMNYFTVCQDLLLGDEE